VALVQFSGDREGVSECHRIVTLDRQWDSLEKIGSLTRISRDVGQSAAQLRKECDAGCVDGTEGLQSQWLKNVGAWERRALNVIVIIIIIIIITSNGPTHTDKFLFARCRYICKNSSDVRIFEISNRIE